MWLDPGELLAAIMAAPNSHRMRSSSLSDNSRT
jgi:hypothetical protein